MARRAAKTDENHAAIRDHLRNGGWCVWDSSAVGRGFGDFIVSRLGHTAVIEAKVGAKGLNEFQRAFRDKWQGAYFIVRSPDDAERQLTLWLLNLAKWK